MQKQKEIKKQRIEAFVLTKSSGQVLLEVLIGISLVALAISLGTMLVLGGQQIIGDRINALEARGTAKEGVRAAMLILGASEDWDGFTDGAYGLSFDGGEWSFSGEEDVDGKFIRKITVNSLDEWRKAIHAEVSWEGSSGTNFVRVLTLLTKWQDVVDDGGGPGSGDTGLSGDWTNPRTLSDFNVSPAGRKGTDIRAFGDYLYLSTYHDDEITHDDFTIFDISDPTEPVGLAEISINRLGINAIEATSTRVFAVSKDGGGELFVIDISDLNNLATTTIVDLGGTNDGISLFLSDNYLYLGKQSETGLDDFLIFDVSTPDSPQLLGGFDVGGDVNKIYVFGEKAYLATSLNNKELLILDVSDKENPFEIGHFNAANAGKSVHVTRTTRVFLGTNNTFYALNASDPENVTEFGSKSTGSNGVVNDMAVVGNLAFLATSHANQVLQIMDIADPENMTVVSTFNFPQVATGVDYQNNLVFTSVRSNSALRIITSGN